MLDELLHHHHFELDFPEDVPDEMRYLFIRQFWSESHFPMRIGETHIDFCDFEEENCPFPGYCFGCADFAADYAQEKEAKEKGLFEGEIPF